MGAPFSVASHTPPFCGDSNRAVVEQAGGFHCSGLFMEILAKNVPAIDMFLIVVCFFLFVAFFFFGSSPEVHGLHEESLRRVFVSLVAGLFVVVRFLRTSWDTLLRAVLARALGTDVQARGFFRRDTGGVMNHVARAFLLFVAVSSAKT